MGKIVPDGPRFSHWGGKEISCDLATRLSITYQDRVLDLCCGEGGTTDYLGPAKLVIVLDISEVAIAEARRTATNPQAKFVVADGKEMPFPDEFFTKIICQDADVFMATDKISVLSECRRVLAHGGGFIWQSYVTNENPMSSKTRQELIKVGYFENEMPYAPQIPNLFEKSGFRLIEAIDLHDTYKDDNLRMLKICRNLFAEFPDDGDEIQKYVDLLEWESELFASGLWSGMLVIAERR